jgi:hypothetical protein
MIGSFFYTPNGRAFAIVGRSGSYAITYAATDIQLREMPLDWPNHKPWHPIYARSVISRPLSEYNGQAGLAVLVRDPVERFRSACSHANIPPDIAIQTVFDTKFRSLEQAGLIRDDITYFRFPDQINECANWLGLTSPVIHINQSDEYNKPVLSHDQLEKIKRLYSADMSLWESIQ